jgi:PAS domain S-box-containing protein
VADQPTIRDATDASRPTTGGGDRTTPKKIVNGAPTGPDRPFDSRDVEIARLKRERDEWRARERVTRAEVDQLHERLILLSQASKRFAASMRGGTSERQRYRRRVGAQYAVSRVLAEAPGLREAAPKIMQILGDRLGWEMGVLWMVSDNALRCESIWRSPVFPPGSFEEACRRASFSRGAGLPGWVWSRGEPVLTQHLLEEEDPLGEAASEAGLRGAIAFPVRDGGLVGVFELFRACELIPDDDLLPTVALVGRQIGQFVERRRAETERDHSLFREREARRELSNILESISDAFFAVDREWRFTYVNKSAEELWSRARGDLLGKNLWKEFPQAAGSVQYETISRAMKERTTTSFEAISPIVGVWVAGRAYPSTNGGVAVYFDDVTERKRAEEELRESEERYRTLFESIDEGFCVVEVMFDADGEPMDYRFLETNPAFERQTGLHEATGKRMRELAPDHEAHWFEIYGHVAETGESVRFVREAKALGGRWFDVYAFRLGGREGSRVAIVFKDVTERKRSEEALRESEELHRLIVEGARDYAIFTTDLSGRIESWPPGAAEIFGWTSEEAIGRPSAMLFVPEDRASGEPEKELATAREEDVAPDVRWHLRKDGSRVFIQGITRYLRDARGLPRGFLKIGQDVTERKRTEEERERLVAHELTARAQAEERRRLSRELHDRVAHDMALVHQSLELHAALKESDPERAEAKMKLAKATAKEALHSTRNLSMELRQPEVRQGLRAALSNLLRDVVPPAVDSRILVKGDEDTVPPDLRNQLFVVLREAVRNAVTHSGCANIVVRLNISSERVVGYVEDDGRGFDAHAPHPADHNGLNSMEERASLLGGTLGVSSTPGRGTTIQVTVPLGERNGK